MKKDLRVPFPFPLRPDFLAKIELPADLTSAEALRVAQYVLTIGDDERAPQPICPYCAEPVFEGISHRGVIGLGYCRMERDPMSDQTTPDSA